MKICRIYILVFFLAILSSMFYLPAIVFGKTVSGEAEYMPWSGYWWPLSRGELIFGYQGHLSPLEKYDLFLSGRYPGNATAWEKANHYGPNLPSWAGYCASWVNASILEDIDFSPSVHKGIFFDIGDKKGLITLCHANDPQIVENCNNDPSVFHQYLLEYVGQNGIPIGADLDSSPAVWTYPVYWYQMDITQGGAYDDVTCTIRYADDFVSPDYQGTRVRFAIYDYRLFKNAQGSYTSGTWTGYSVNSHPEFVWIPVSQRAENPYLDYETIYDIAVSQEKGIQPNAALVPGHYAVILSPGEVQTLDMDLTAPGSLNVSLVFDSQSSSGASAAYGLEMNGQDVFSGEFSDLLQSFSQTITNQTTGSLNIQADTGNSAAVFAHLYLDEYMAQTEFLLHIPSDSFWIGMAVAGRDPNVTNRIHLTYLTEAGLPAGSASTLSHLDADANWVGILNPDQAFDTYSWGQPSLVKVSSEYPVSSLEFFGNGSVLWGPPAIGNRAIQGNQAWVVPALTETFNFNQSARLYLFNGADDETTYTIDYYGPDNEFVAEKLLTMTSRQFQEFSAGNYPGNVNLDGWAVLHDTTGQLVGQVEIREGFDKMDALSLLTGGTSFYSPHIPCLNGWQSTLTLFNLEDSPNDVALVFVNGGSIENGPTIFLGPHEKRALTMDSFTLDLPEESIHAACLQISASGAVAGFVSYRYQNNSMASLPLFEGQDFSETKTLCHVSSNSAWWTGMALMNGDANDTDVMFMGYNAQGLEIARTTRHLDGGMKMVILIRGLFPGQFQSIKSLKIDSEMPVAGLALFGGIPGNGLLSGIVLE